MQPGVYMYCVACIYHVLMTEKYHTCGVTLTRRLVDQARKCMWLGLDADDDLSTRHIPVTGC